MKHVFNLFTAALPMLCIPVLAHAQDNVAELRDQQLHFELKAATPDDEMLEIARAANVNLFMDATEVIEKPSLATTRAPEHTDWQLEHLISNLTVARRLAWRFDPENRAFWVSAEPDIKQLRQQLL